MENRLIIRNFAYRHKTHDKDTQNTRSCSLRSHLRNRRRGRDAAREIRQSGASIRVLSAGVEIVNDTAADCDVMVYAITGQLMKHVAAAPGITQIDLAPGCYVVRVDGLSKRIIIK